MDIQVAIAISHLTLEIAAFAIYSIETYLKIKKKDNEN